MNAALTPLAPSALWGGCEIRRGDPGIETFEDVFVLPYRNDGPWGVFDASGRLLRAATDLRSPAGELMHQAPQSDVAREAITAEAPEPEMVYGGRLHGHYGHFVIESLSRLWPFIRKQRPSARLLMHAYEGSDFLWSRGYVSEAFSALGLSPEDVVLIDRPMRVRRLVTPRASFQQQAFAHRVFKELCGAIGLGVRSPGASSGLGGAITRRLSARLGRSAPDTPMYVSKRWLISGVRGVGNDGEIEAALSAAGVDVLYPELTPFADQLHLFATRKVILGTAGSALHTTIFGPPRRLLAVNPEPMLNSNFVIFDRLNGNRAAYFHAENEETPPEDGRTFGRNYRFKRPQEIAAELLRLI